MTRDEVTALLRQHLDALNRHDSAALRVLYSEDAVVTSPMFNQVRGRAEIGEAFAKLFTLWPDYGVQLRDPHFICEGSRAAEFSVVTASHSAELFGLPPTGERIEYESVRLFTFKDHLIVEERRLYDLAGILERLGKARLDRELRVAGDIQRLLLPRTEQTGAFFHAVGASMPSRAIGGDFFEYMDLPSGDFGMALGDASGKGPAAALVAAIVQGIFSVEAENHTPSVTLSRVNHALRRRGMEPHFVTLVYGVLSPDGRLCYSNAGQNPPILLTRDGVRHLGVGGPMLGVFDDATFPEDTVCLQTGDMLIAFSDGLTEARNRAGEEFTDERLLACVRGRHHETPQAILDALVGEVRAFGDGVAQSDDVTAVVMRFR